MQPTFGRRLGAFAIDTGILFLQAWVWGRLFKVMAGPGPAPDTHEMWSAHRGPALGMLLLSGGAVYVPACYWLAGGATFGKQMMGIRLTTKSGAPLEPLRAVGRWFARFLTWFTWPTEAIRLAIRPNGPTLADLAAGTIAAPATPREDGESDLFFRFVAIFVNAAIGFACVWTLRQ